MTTIRGCGKVKLRKKTVLKATDKKRGLNQFLVKKLAMQAPKQCRTIIARQKPKL